MRKINQSSLLTKHNKNPITLKLQTSDQVTGGTGNTSSPVIRERKEELQTGNDSSFAHEKGRERTISWGGKGE